MIKITRIHTEVETVNYLDKEYDEYNAKERRVFIINDDAFFKFKESMQQRRDKDTIERLNNMVKHGYISQHWG
jgi:hypothetical protein